jgi:hypothetical protein
MAVDPITVKKQDGDGLGIVDRAQLVCGPLRPTGARLTLPDLKPRQPVALANASDVSSAHQP